MKTTPIDTIEIVDRQRKEFTPKLIEELKNSIVSKGLMHPVVLRTTATEGQYRLIAGERRLRAISELHEDGLTFSHDQQTVEDGLIPFVLLSELSEADFAEAELQENLIRTALTWQEEAEARALIHQLRKAKNPAQTETATAIEVSEMMNTTVAGERKILSDALLIAKHKDNPLVKTAKNRRDAVTSILDEVEKKYTAQLARRTQNLHLEHTIIHGDCLEEIKKLPAEKFSAIICDPPYGVDADTWKKTEQHLYKDDAAYALEICRTIIREGFRVTKAKAFMFMFCDIDHFVSLRDYASQQAWSAWRVPIVWQKGKDGHAPWGRGGFIRTTELLLFCVKGGIELYKPGGPDVLSFSRPSRSNRVHAAEKPYELLDYLLSLTCLPGDAVLDPCAGSGSILPPAIARKLHITAIETSDTYITEINSKLIRKAPPDESSNS